MKLSSAFPLSDEEPDISDREVPCRKKGRPKKKKDTKKKDKEGKPVKAKKRKKIVCFSFFGAIKLWTICHFTDFLIL